jgi:hypothetical protein
VETVVLAFIIPWPIVRDIALVLDIWGVYFIIAVYASFVVRPHVIHADGCAELSQGGQTTVTVQLTRPVTFTRPLGKTACASALRFYAADPAAAVAAIRARALQTTPSR